MKGRVGEGAATTAAVAAQRSKFAQVNRFFFFNLQLIYSLVIVHALWFSLNQTFFFFFFHRGADLARRGKSEGVMWLVLIGPSWAGSLGGTGN